MNQRALDHPGHDLHVPVRVGLEAGARTYDVVVVDQQYAVMGVGRVLVPAEGEGVFGAKPGELRRVPLIGTLCEMRRASTAVRTYGAGMCRNITELRGLEPAATDDEIAAAARQYVRKVSGLRDPSGAQHDAFEAAVQAVTASTARLLDQLPERRQPPKTVPPLRRPDVRARIAAREAAS